MWTSATTDMIITAVSYTHLKSGNKELVTQEQSKRWHIHRIYVRAYLGFRNKGGKRSN